MNYGDYMESCGPPGSRISPPSCRVRSFAERTASHGAAGGVLGAPPDPVSEALGRIVDGIAPTAMRTPLEHYPPQMRLSDHDGRLHVHFAHDDAPAEA